MPPLSATQQAYVDRLYRYLRVQRAAPEAILAGFRRLPRHHFVDRVYLPPSEGSPPVAVGISPETDEPKLLDAVYTDNAVSIQIERGVPTSSTSQPSLMARMMVDVDLRPGKRVLEIGTATGWNAALMAEVVGPDGHVVSVEVDPDLAARARCHLAAAGYSDLVTVLTGNGAAGAAEHGPYDAVVVTVACPDLPRPWLAGLKPGGALVTPFALPDGSAPMLVLRRDRGWTGRFKGWSWFVSVRGEGWDTWPDPLAARDEPLASRLRDPVQRRSLPWGGIGPAYDVVHHLGFFLLLTEPATFVVVREPDEQGRDQLRPGLATPAGVALLEEHEVRGYGDPEPMERLLARAEEWLQLDSPRLSEYRVSVGTETPYRLVRRETTLGLRL